MEMASIIDQYYDAFIDKHGNTALPSHRKALQAMQKSNTSVFYFIFLCCQYFKRFWLKSKKSRSRNRYDDGTAYT